MMNSNFGATLWCVLALSMTLNLHDANRSAFAQSPIVFMTAEDVPTSRLYRFDNGVESFGVTAGPSAAFLGVTIHNGNVLVADFGGEAIQRYSPSGTLLAPFALFLNPTFLESDHSGNVYTTPFSIGAPVATRFNSAGVVTQTYTHPAMREAAGVDADAAGNVYVVDGFGATSTIFKFAANGTFINQTAIGSINGADIAIDELSNRLYLADESGGGAGVKIFDISGAAPTFAGSITTPANANTIGVHFAAESGNILATDFGAGSFDPRGLEFSPSGTLLREYRPAAAELALDITTFVIPEPGSLVLVCVGACVLLLRCRRRTLEQ